MECGTLGHDPGCLCDVIVAEVAPINYGLTEVWHAAAIARAMEVSVPWTSSSMVDFGESLLKAYDIWSRGSRRGERIEGEVLRMKVCDLLRAGVSMVDVAAELELPWKTIIRAMTNEQPATVWAWDRQQWRDAEAVIYDRFASCSKEKLADMLDVHMCVIDQLSEWYGVKYNQQAHDRLEYLRGLLASGLHPLDALAYAKEAGYEATDQQLYHLRKRMAQRGEVSAPLPKRERRPRVAAHVVLGASAILFGAGVTGCAPAVRGNHPNATPTVERVVSDRRL